MYCLQLLPLGVGQAEGGPAVHEDQVVVEQRSSVMSSELLADVGADFQLAAGGVHQVRQRPGAALQPPGWRRVATYSRPRSIRSPGVLRRSAAGRSLSLVFSSRLVA